MESEDQAKLDELNSRLIGKYDSLKQINSEKQEILNKRVDIYNAQRRRVWIIGAVILLMGVFGFIANFGGLGVGWVVTLGFICLIAVAAISILKGAKNQEINSSLNIINDRKDNVENEIKELEREKAVLREQMSLNGRINSDI
ncbi:MAG: hypothetical protein VZR00_03085 [Lachnospiraceae bacterium]|jgi:hypothetical protein|nr:hypothetical protein [Lachnospiraceae bacterium]MEE3460861.1 hypothetical protein [Lachnospiraceae bacterium]